MSASPDFWAIRGALRATLSHQSIRALAREIGISAAGLRYVVERAEAPYGATTRKLRAWYVRQRARAPGEDAVAAAAPSAVTLLVEMLPLDAQTEARERLLDTLRQTCADAGHALPESVAAAFAPDAEP